MDTIFALLACCLLVLSLPGAQLENQNLTTATPSPGVTVTLETTKSANVTLETTKSANVTLETTKSATSDSTLHATVTSNSTEHTTRYTSTVGDDGKFNNTTATTKSTSQQTSEAATVLTTLINTTLMTTTQSTSAPASATLTAHTIHSTSCISTPDSAITENPLCTCTTATESVNRTTQGVRLNVSEKAMTIIFSAVLVLFVLALVMIMFHKCKHKFQYSHQPLSDADETGGFVADEDTLVISGGLYDGHPIYDHVPPAPEDQSQFRLEFLH